MTAVLQRQGFAVGQKRVRSAMRRMGLEAIYPKPHLSASHPEHKKYPYLLKNMIVSHPNQVWAADIIYVPLMKGFEYLFAIIDWYSRYVIDWQLSNFLDAEFCLEAVDRAFAHSRPELFNTDQGAQFTSRRFATRIEDSGAKISMDGRGRAFDNIMVERLWRSVKYEDIYPRAYGQLPELQRGIKA